MFTIPNSATFLAASCTDRNEECMSLSVSYVAPGAALIPAGNAVEFIQRVTDEQSSLLNTILCWCRFFKAQIQAGMLEKARENATQTWTIMAATAGTELLRRMQPLSRPPSFPAIDAFPALRKQAQAKLDSMESRAAGRPWGLLLCGMGGIGKTTLAKVMYSLLPDRSPDAR